MLASRCPGSAPVIAAGMPREEPPDFRGFCEDSGVSRPTAPGFRQPTAFSLQTGLRPSAFVHRSRPVSRIALKAAWRVTVQSRRPVLQDDNLSKSTLLSDPIRGVAPKSSAHLLAKREPSGASKKPNDFDGGELTTAGSSAACRRSVADSRLAAGRGRPFCRYRPSHPDERPPFSGSGEPDRNGCARHPAFAAAAGGTTSSDTSR